MNQSNLVQDILGIRNLLQNNTIGILLGERMNLDTAAAALAMYLSLNEAGKKPQIISQKEPTVEIANLVGINKIKKSFSGDSNKLVVSLPYIKGEIGKVSYKEENDRINFYLTAVDGRSITTYDTNDINLIWDGSMPSVIIAFGVGSASQLSNYVNTNNNSVKIINIDNGGETFGDISIVDSAFSSISEIVAKIISELKLPMNIDIAQNLLDGILFSTRNFTKNNTSAYAFESAGILMQGGAVRTDNRNSGRGLVGQQARPQSNNNQNNNQNRNQNNQNRPNNQFSQNVNSQNMNQNRNNDRVNNIQKAAPQNPAEDFNTVINEPEMPQSAPQQNTDIPEDWLMPKVFKGSQNADDLK